jgi:hypothetical protein
MAEGSNRPDAPPSMGNDSKKTAWDWQHRTTVLGIILMALATLGSSWNTYQSSLWNGVQTFRLMDAAGFSREAEQHSTAANQLRGLEAALFVEYARDLYDGKTAMSDFILARMRPELREAVKAWVATRPLVNPQSPSSPLVMPQYRARVEDEVRDLQAKSSAAYDQAQKANRTSDTYTLLGVLFTAALFLAGLVSGFDDKLARRLVLILSVTTLLVATVIMLRLPVAHIG